MAGQVFFLIIKHVFENKEKTWDCKRIISSLSGLQCNHVLKPTTLRIHCSDQVE